MVASGLNLSKINTLEVPPKGSLGGVSRRL